MTSKMRGALDALKRFQHDADYEADKLVKRIETEGRPKLKQGMAVAHDSLDKAHGTIDDIIDFADELAKSNGGELGNSESGSGDAPPRSSEVGQR